MPRIPRLQPVGLSARALVGCAIALGVLLLCLLLRQAEPIDALELQLIDVRTRHVAGRVAPDARILICQIQESDVAWVRKAFNEPWPWSLEYNGFLASVLEAGGARALMVDILHLDRGAGPSDLPAGTELDAADEARREGEAFGAAAYGEALRSFGRAAVGYELATTSTYELPGRVAAAEKRLGKDTEAALSGEVDLVRPYADLPVLGVLEGAAALGFTNAPADRDGIARRATCFGLWGRRRVQSLPMATLGLVRPSEQSAEGAAPCPAGGFLVDFRSRTRDGGYPRIEPARLLSWAKAQGETGTLPDDARAVLEGKIVIFGINIAGIQDVVATPIGTLDGPVYQATILDNLLHEGGRTRVAGWLETLFLVVLAFLIALIGTLSPGRFLPHLVPLVLGGAFVALSYALFSAGTVTDLFIPLACVFFTWGATTMFRLMTAGKRNKWLEGTFGRYVSPTIIESLKQDPTMLKLGGRKRDITVLFSDVASFTSASEQLGPEKTVTLLNRYLTNHCEAIFVNDGIVDKFEGDAVMAFFGDPLPQGDHPVRACRAALRVVHDLPLIEPVWREMGLAAFGIRIGLNSGEAFVGNMGSEQRFDYTCMGQTVNLASRIEGANKIFSSVILVGPLTESEARAEFLFKPLGDVLAIGASEPLPLFELVAERGLATAEQEAHVAAFTRAIEAVRADDLEAARTHLEAARTLIPGDGPCAWLAALLDDLESGYSKRPWTGVTEQRDK